MSAWEKKLQAFLATFAHAKDMAGVLVCGSYITGNPTAHSDLDVHILLDNAVTYRERGNKIVDGLLIEYFANPYKQILRYFKEDLQEKSLMCQTQFATGKILLDKTGEVQTLKDKAREMIAEFYASRCSDLQISALSKYFLWDMRDDLQDAYENRRADFDFLYFTRLQSLLKIYMNGINLPYESKAILGNIVDPNLREKYLLRELPDENTAQLIARALTAESKAEKLAVYEQLTAQILTQAGGFDIDGFALYSGVDG
ncbi:MAG: hypothetical protein FWC16_10535 [Defluviitaleaceae bacterium]|nr:hypothetical protein [Defluviitaleaceae bacterium]MCL2275353.1 hypothetical protein [Defluviitaleaceae bacterium]